VEGTGKLQGSCGVENQNMPYDPETAPGHGKVIFARRCIFFVFAMAGRTGRFSLMAKLVQPTRKQGSLTDLAKSFCSRLTLAWCKETQFPFGPKTDSRQTGRD
jgi:hypothetical protein